jgi:phosphatidylglycerophosphate synthase
VILDNPALILIRILATVVSPNLVKRVTLIKAHRDDLFTDK